MIQVGEDSLQELVWLCCLLPEIVCRRPNRVGQIGDQVVGLEDAPLGTLLRNTLPGSGYPEDSDTKIEPHNQPHTTFRRLLSDLNLRRTSRYAPPFFSVLRSKKNSIQWIGFLEKNATNPSKRRHPTPTPVSVQPHSDPRVTPYRPDTPNAAQHPEYPQGHFSAHSAPSGASGSERAVGSGTLSG